MKVIKLVACLMLLNSIALKSSACSYYPTGEDVRFSLFSSNMGRNTDMEALFYSTHFFNEYTQNALKGPNENLEEWKVYFKHQFDLETIDELIYKTPFDKPNKRIFENKLYQYLQNGKQKKVGNYILFAKKVEYILRQDYWSNKTIDLEKAEKALQIAKKECRKNNSEILKLRYGYQAMVLSYYLKDYEEGLKTYTEVIAPLDSESVIAIWCLFHKANMSSDKLERARDLAIVFEKSRSKNIFIFRNFPKDPMVINAVMEKCETDQEKAAVQTILAFRNPGRAIEQISEIAALNSKTNLLDVLLVREINKIEDWYFTERYAGIVSYARELFSDEQRIDFKGVDQINFQADQNYLNQFKQRCRALVDIYEIENTTLWYCSLAYMSYMLEEEGETSFYLDLANKSHPSELEMGQIKTIELLALVRFESNWNSEFQDKLYGQIKALENYSTELYNYERFIGQVMLVISRKYLKEGNLTLAALFEAKVSGGTYETYGRWGRGAYKGFDVLNENGNTEALDAFFEYWNKPNKTEMEAYLFENMEPLKWRYTDLWGTMYLREDKLEKALAIYETIPDSVWEITDVERHYYYKNELDANPFETRFSRSTESDDKSISYTKPQFVRELIGLKKEVEATEKGRSYNYMLLGNAYYNMTVEGNSWYYTEYGLFSGEKHEGASGQNENYFNGNRAKKYYKLAEETSNSKPFAAFCYRLQYKCEYLSKLYEEDDYFSMDDYEENFKMKYPSYYEDLKGCDRFDYYLGTGKDG